MQDQLPKIKLKANIDSLSQPFLPHTKKIEKTPDAQTPPPPENTPPSVLVTSAKKKRSFPKLPIPLILSLIVVIIGLIIGAILIKQNLDLRKEAASGSECDHASDCILLDNPGNSGSYQAPKTIHHIFITARYFHRYDPGDTNDGCYHVIINNTNLQWDRVGSGPDCKDISNIQIWITNGEQPTPTPTTTHITAACGEVKAYDTSWNQLSMQQLSLLNPGETVIFAISGTTSSGNFDKARFTVNGAQQPETSDYHSQTNQFYDEYQIPTGVTSFTIEAQIHHQQLDRWF